MKRLLILMMLAAMLNNGYSQEKSDTLWRFSGITSINFSQLSLSNWAAGGENSIGGNAMLNFTANYKSANENVNWNNDLIMGYGLLRQSDDPVRKSDDKIDLASKFGYKAGTYWYYSGLFSFKTQFAQGFDRPGDADRVAISDFMSPAYLNLSFGMDYKPSEALSVLIAPVTGKMTVVLDDVLSAAGSFGVPAGQKVRGEFGGYLKIAYSKEILKNINLITKIDLFSNYLDHPERVDVNFDLLLNFKINEYISASLMSQLIYDYDIKFPYDTNNDGINDGLEPRVQLKELFGIGLTYKF